MGEGPARLPPPLGLCRHYPPWHGHRETQMACQSIRGGCEATSTAVTPSPSVLSEEWFLHLLPPMPSMKSSRDAGGSRTPGPSGLLEPTVVAASGCPCLRQIMNPCPPSPLSSSSLCLPLAPLPHCLLFPSLYQGTEVVCTAL